MFTDAELYIMYKPPKVGIPGLRTFEMSSITMETTFTTLGTSSLGAANFFGRARCFCSMNTTTLVLLLGRAHRLRGRSPESVVSLRP